MAMKRCPVCGERYSDTYKTCPFCEEDELWEEEESQRPLKNHRSSRGNQHSFITPTLIVLIILMAALLVYLLYGDKVSQLFGKESDSTPGNDIVEPQQPSPGGLPTPPAGDGDEDPDLSDTPGGTEPDGAIRALPATPASCPKNRITARIVPAARLLPEVGRIMPPSPNSPAA